MDHPAMEVNGGGGGAVGMGMGAGGGGVLDFVQRFQQLQLQRVASEDLIKDLLVYCGRIESELRQENETLRKAIRNAEFDLQDAIKSRRDLQQKVGDLEQHVGLVSVKNEHLKNHNPYVIILIDGDGCHFQQRLIKQGIEGGKQAAYALRNAILKECHGSDTEIEVSARVIANLSGLSYITRASGTVEDERIVKDFTLGFTQGMASFDFIDVGRGKERADTKIKEAIRWHLRNYNCRQIILGVSFDAGYASFLDQVLRDESSRQRITILEGPPSHRDLLAHRLNTLTLNEEILRHDKLEALERPFDRRMSNPRPLTPPATVAGMSPLPPPPATPASVPHPSNGTSTPSSYAIAAVKPATPPPQIKLPIAPKPTKSAARREKPAPWNPGARGLDPPLEVNQSALDTIKKRKDNNKLCNNHYLRGPCAKGDACCFEHKYKPNEAEKTAIAFLARLNPCTSGQECDIADCIYGHHASSPLCPSTRDGLCMHPYCKFKPWEHPPNTRFKGTYSHDE